MKYFGLLIVFGLSLLVLFSGCITNVNINDVNLVSNDNKITCKDRACFDAEFAKCTPNVEYIATTSFADFSYHINGLKIDSTGKSYCEIVNEYTKNPNPQWQNVKMICLYDTKLSLDDSLKDVFKAKRCTGDLANLMFKDSPQVVIEDDNKPIVIKTGCQYNNPSCNSNTQDCINNQCVTKSGCLYLNPDCNSGFICSDNVCILKENNIVQVVNTGCQYNNPMCSTDQECINNACILKVCNYDGSKNYNDNSCIINSSYTQSQINCMYNFLSSDWLGEKDWTLGINERELTSCPGYQGCTDQQFIYDAYSRRREKLYGNTKSHYDLCLLSENSLTYEIFLKKYKTCEVGAVYDYSSNVGGIPILGTYKIVTNKGNNICGIEFSYKSYPDITRVGPKMICDHNTIKDFNTFMGLTTCSGELKNILLGITPKLDCGNDKTCFETAFSSCAVGAKVDLNISVMGNNIIYHYEIIANKGNNICSLKSYYLQNPNPEFVGPTMECDYDNTLSFDASGAKVLKNIDNCTGDLKYLLGATK